MADIFKTDIILDVYRSFSFLVPLSAGIIILAVNKIWKPEDKSVFLYFGAAAIVGTLVLFWKGAGLQVFFFTLPVINTSIVLILVFLVLSLLFAASFENEAPYILILASLFIVSIATANLLLVASGLVSATVAAGLNEKDPNRLKFMIVADIALLLGTVFFYGATGSFNIVLNDELFGYVNKYRTGNYFKLSFIFIAAAVIAKLGTFPFGRFCKNGAIDALSRTGTAFVFINIFCLTSSLWSSFMRVPLLIMAAISMVASVFYLVRAKQTEDFLRFFASSNMGFILCLVALAHAGGTGREIAVFIVIAYALIYFGTAVSKNKILLIFFLLASAGVPPLVGFIARFGYIAELISNGAYWILVVSLFTFLAIFYSAVRVIYGLRKAVISEENKEIREFSFLGTTAVIIAAVLVALLGIFPSNFIGWLAQIS